MFCPNPECSVVKSTGEAAEYAAGVTQCSDCQTSLVEAAPELGEERMAYDELVPIRDITNPALEPVVESLLESAGIRFFIKGERVQDLFGAGRFGTGFNTITGPPRVYVEPERAEEARDLLADLDKPSDEPASEE